MSKYTKEENVVEVIQLRPYNLYDILKWIKGSMGVVRHDDKQLVCVIPMAHDEALMVFEGEYLLKDHLGEFSKQPSSFPAGYVQVKE